ncbi:Selenocysteine-specific elongation factor [Trichinella pseudospiralis]|uniref:Selenocysteine-specific elongation factor n=1 Tax=Trichinella pseudospiralis TaxID=6337 RepID=A0A0V0XQ39_TRIPS|nr:Selenocysteine-specific elongation factor [Trichinella pseudospiralis]
MAERTFNFNVGIMGHVDSGKTTLAKALSTVASTAAFDKHPQSKQRGITLDLGFSSFLVDIPEKLKSKESKFSDYDTLQITLVDCPGHGSLFRTVIGGSRIMDMVLLVIDICKGIQPQTAECIVLADITCPKRMLIALNKIDLLPNEGKAKATAIEKFQRRLRKTLQNTSFADVPMIAVSALDEAEKSETLKTLIDCLVDQVYCPHRSAEGKFLFYVDHCFNVKGQGTVLTGTVISGSVGVKSVVEIPTLNEKRKIKSIQIFHKAVESIAQGSRAGICVAQFDTSRLERGVVCESNCLQKIQYGVVSVSAIVHYKHPLRNNSKFHVTVGYETVIGKFIFFHCEPHKCRCAPAGQFALESNYLKQEDENMMPDANDSSYPLHRYAVVQFEQAIFCFNQAQYIASKLDQPLEVSACRIAFHGQMLQMMPSNEHSTNWLKTLPVFKRKIKRGTICNILDQHTVAVRGMFSKTSSLVPFLGCKVTLLNEHRTEGVIEGWFGKSGKIKVRFPNPLSEQFMQTVTASSANTGDSSRTVLLEFQASVFDSQNRMLRVGFRRIFNQRALWKQNQLTASWFMTSIQTERISANRQISCRSVCCSATVFKKRKFYHGKDEDNEEEYEEESATSVNESDDNNDDEEYAGSKKITMNVLTPRLDSVVKAGFAFSKKIATDFILEGKVFVNGERVFKKGYEVCSRDTIDVLLGRSSECEKFVDVARLILLNVSHTKVGSKLSIVARRWKRLTVNEYNSYV